MPCQGDCQCNGSCEGTDPRAQPFDPLEDYLAKLEAPEWTYAGFPSIDPLAEQPVLDSGAWWGYEPRVLDVPVSRGEEPRAATAQADRVPAMPMGGTPAGPIPFAPWPRTVPMPWPDGAIPALPLPHLTRRPPPPPPSLAHSPYEGVPVAQSFSIKGDGA